MKNKLGPILVVEDDQSSQRLIHMALEELGVKNPVVFSNNGIEGLDYIKKHGKEIFLIISDINMPKMNGLDLLKEIYNDINLRIQSIPFVFLTSSATKEEIMLAYSLSAQGYFLKPTEYPNLLGVMDIIIKYWSVSHLPRV